MMDRLRRREPVEFLAEEFVDRRRRGELPTVAEYSAGYPELSKQIEELFPMIVLLERFRTLTEGGR